MCCHDDSPAGSFQWNRFLQFVHSKSNKFPTNECRPPFLSKTTKGKDLIVNICFPFTPLLAGDAAALRPRTAPPTRPFIRSLVRPDQSSLKPSPPHEDARAFPRVARQLSLCRRPRHISHIKWLSAELWSWSSPRSLCSRGAMEEGCSCLVSCIPASSWLLSDAFCSSWLWENHTCSPILTAVNTHAPRRRKCKQALKATAGTSFSLQGQHTSHRHLTHKMNPIRTRTGSTVSVEKLPVTSKGNTEMRP